jgi:ATP-binding cassette subfamily B protein
MHMMGGPSGLRSFWRDKSVTKHKVAPGTARRMFGFARPYRRLLTFFLIMIVVDALLGAINPLLFRGIINEGIIGHDRGLVVTLASIAAVGAVPSARWA